MTIATLVKITPARKLMMKISDKTYGMITGRLIAECKKKGFPTDRLATFPLANEDGDESFFVMISLDKYDKQNMRKFEVLLKKDVAIQYRFKPYDFIPDGEDEQRCGINLELISIRQVDRQKLAADKELIESLKQTKSKAKWNADLWNFEINEEELQCMMQKANAMGKHLVIDPTGAHFCSSDDSDSEIDEIADKAAARACSKETELNAEEQAIDEDVEKAAAGYLMKKVRRSQVEKLEKELQQAREQAAAYEAWVEKRQNATISPLEAQMKALEDASDE